MAHTIIDKDTKVPLYAVYVILGVVVLVVGFLVRLEVVQAGQTDRLDRQKEAIMKLREEDQKLADTQLQTAVKLAEFAGEVRIIKEIQFNKK